ncbi:MAG: 16S rRNA (cytosine(967)-C(5))-methyltransferase RsmB [Christensenella sp.]|uniref:16S rRNA (cytosine(967)-C(5))-methyltransferase RsmB n=1 Tax=Christensenella sp. TaxID=1935934 RepID=UPI002B21EF39|nr:16S rRNA (cytosine(967)-C(5))-methyltransferase RsmB [Christensenella sp.]MEA5002454.1 16S rRNA (cytosine(967)-C(5))-methyltransferase RsmB [Christensenella sp.]
MNARQVALDVLSNVLKNQSYLNLELKRALKPSWTIEDRRFITALVSTTIENLCRIDYILLSFTSGKRLHTVIRNILRLGVCQLAFFESVPVSAAVNESVKLVKGSNKPQLSGFVNAVLRNISKNLGKIEYPDRKKNPAEFLHVFYSYPKWLSEKYIAEYGVDFTEQMFSYRADSSLTCVRVQEKETFALTDQFLPGKYCDDAYYIRNAANIENMPMFLDGTLTVQGEASMLCVRAAGIRPADTVLDTCAAPGGKSAYAAKFAADGYVRAMELHTHRAQLIEKTFERLHTKNADIRVADASKYDSSLGKFDVVLVDAPCSALGLLYRKPDIKISKNEEDITSLVILQREILDTSAKYVKSGGTLLYSTCTIDKKENEENTNWFLETHKDFKVTDIKQYLPAELAQYATGCSLQLFPHRDEIDGFFMARLEKI